MYNDELYHYGVKGMKWGHRKKYYNKDGSLNTTGQQRELKKQYKEERRSAATRSERKTAKQRYKNNVEKTYHKDYDALTREIDRYNIGKRGMNRINDRMKSGQSYLKASTIEYTKTTAKGAVMAAAVLASPYIAGATVSSIQKFANTKARQRANASLARIGTLQYEKIAKNVYRQVMK